MPYCSLVQDPSKRPHNHHTPGNERGSINSPRPVPPHRLTPSNNTHHYTFATFKRSPFIRHSFQQSCIGFFFITFISNHEKEILSNEAALVTNHSMKKHSDFKQSSSHLRRSNSLKNDSRLVNDNTNMHAILSWMWWIYEKSIIPDKYKSMTLYTLMKEINYYLHTEDITRFTQISGHTNGRQYENKQKTQLR